LAEETAPEDARAVYEIARRRYGAVPTSLGVVAHHTEILRAVVGYERALADASRVDARLKSLASVKVASLVGCPF
jgi:alkylhydroperoxidase family enzyme